MKKFETINEFENFDFSETVIGDVEIFENTLRLCLDNVKIKPENSKNIDVRMMRTNCLILAFQKVTFQTFFREGLKYYDANGKLLREEPDELIDFSDLHGLRTTLTEGTIYSIEKKETTYVISFDATDEYPYQLIFEAETDSESWDRFMNL